MLWKALWFADISNVEAVAPEVVYEKDDLQILQNSLKNAGGTIFF